MLTKFLKEIVVIIAGKQAEQIVDLLDGKKYVNEFIIAKKLNLTINQTRNILYRISDHGLVSLVRKKDKRKGWYTYFWKIEVMKSLEFLRNEILKKMDQVNHQIRSRETKEFYVCENCNIEFNEESALTHNFTCNECGNIVSRKDNQPVIKAYQKDLERLNKELEMVESELEVEKEKLEKVRMKEAKKQENLKKKETQDKKKAKEKPKKEEKKKTSSGEKKKIKEKTAKPKKPVKVKKKK